MGRVGVWRKGRKKTFEEFWGFDTEFNTETCETYSVQFYKPNCSVFLRKPEDLRTFFNEHKPQLIFGFNLLCDIGAMENWLHESFAKTEIGQQLVAYYAYSPKRPKACFKDIRPFAASMGLHSLAKVGDYVGIQKMDKGALKLSPDDEVFKQYAVRDAEITYRFAKKLCEDFKISPSQLVTPAYLSAKIVDLPQRHAKEDSFVIIPEIEEKIRQEATFAGRSECFLNGYLENYIYLDVASLYPACALISRALEIERVVECEPEDLNLDNRCCFLDYGWVEGTFWSENDIWGLPIKHKIGTFSQNRYHVGFVSGFFHTYDLLAADAKIVKIARTYKPIFKKNAMMRRYEEMFKKKIEKRYEREEEKLMIKMILNSLTGKLAQTNPVPSTRVNYPAYNTIVACAHLIMSSIFEDCEKEKIAGMDTDSLFLPDYYSHMTKGDYAEVSNVPIRLELKHDAGNLLYVRAKMYAYLDGRTVAFHGWRYGRDSMLDALLGGRKVFFKEYKHTLRTREKEALQKPFGFWGYKRVEKSEEELKLLFRCDRKRVRETYDSWDLIANRDFGKSSAVFVG